jgi:hypothetical protein
VAEFLGLSERTIIRRVEQGYFPKPYRIGRSWLFRIRDLRRWLADGNQPGARPKRPRVRLKKPPDDGPENAAAVTGEQPGDGGLIQRPASLGGRQGGLPTWHLAYDPQRKRPYGQ